MFILYTTGADTTQKNKKLANKTPSLGVGLLASLPHVLKAVFCLLKGLLSKNLQMKYLKYVFMFSLLLVPLSSHASNLVACAPGDLFNVFTGQSCQIVDTTPKACESGDLFNIFTGK